MMFLCPDAFFIDEGRNKIIRIVKDTEYQYPIMRPAYITATLNDLHYVTKKIFNEGCFMPDKDVARLQSIAQSHGSGQFVDWFNRYWDDLDKVISTNGLIQEERNRDDEEQKTNQLIRNLKEEVLMSDYAKDMKQARINFLEAENANLSSHLEEMQKQIQAMEDRDCEGWTIDIYKDFNHYEKIRGKILSNKITISHIQGKFDKRVIVTDEMIAQAKRTPFNRLLKLETIGGRERCKCPFHNEKTASFYVYPDTNRGYCHGCGRSVDTIQYMVEVKKLGFNQAVLMLLSY